jgi:hypothetical protein
MEVFMRHFGSFVQWSALTLVLVAAGCSGGGSGGTTGPIATTGSLKVDVATTGIEMDPDGYTVTVGSTTQAVAVNGSATISGLAAGGHDVTLEGVAAN